MEKENENYNVQALGTTLMFFVIIIFGFVFWKMFTSVNIHPFETNDGARTSSQVLGKEALTRFP